MPQQNGPVCPRCEVTETHYIGEVEVSGGNVNIQAAICDDCEVEIAFESAEDPGRPASAGFNIGKEV